ncbi:MAG: hypothetical protein ACOX3W_04025 [Christensenellaceae bacterium]
MAIFETPCPHCNHPITWEDAKEKTTCPHCGETVLFTDAISLAMDAEHTARAEDADIADFIEKVVSDAETKETDSFAEEISPEHLDEVFVEVASEADDAFADEAVFATEEVFMEISEETAANESEPFTLPEESLTPDEIVQALLEDVKAEEAEVSIEEILYVEEVAVDEAAPLSVEAGVLIEEDVVLTEQEMDESAPLAAEAQAVDAEADLPKDAEIPPADVTVEPAAEDALATEVFTQEATKEQLDTDITAAGNAQAAAKDIPTDAAAIPFDAPAEADEADDKAENEYIPASIKEETEEEATVNEEVAARSSISADMVAEKEAAADTAEDARAVATEETVAAAADASPRATGAAAKRDPRRVRVQSRARQEKQEKREKQKVRKFKGKHFVMLAAGIVVLLLLVYTMVLTPMFAYNKGASALEAGDRMAAISAFSDAKWYRDGSEQLESLLAPHIDRALSYEGHFKAEGKALSIQNMTGEVFVANIESAEAPVTLLTGINNYTIASGYLVGVRESGGIAFAQLSDLGAPAPEVKGWDDVKKVLVFENTLIGELSDGSYLPKTIDTSRLSDKNVAGVYDTLGYFCVQENGKVSVPENAIVTESEKTAGIFRTIRNWKNMVMVKGSINTRIVGLQKNGRVKLVKGLQTDKVASNNVSGWRNIVDVAVGQYHTVGLQADGTVVATGNNEHGQCDVSGWTDIVAIEAGNLFTVGIRADGTVLITSKGGTYSPKELVNISVPLLDDFMPEDISPLPEISAMPSLSPEGSTPPEEGDTSPAPGEGDASGASSAPPESTASTPPAE